MKAQWIVRDAVREMETHGLGLIQDARNAKPHNVEERRRACVLFSNRLRIGMVNLARTHGYDLVPLVENLRAESRGFDEVEHAKREASAMAGELSAIRVALEKLTSKEGK